MSVDLPAPFSPINAWTSPGNSRKSTSCRAFTPGNSTEMPRMSTTGSVTGQLPSRGPSQQEPHDKTLTRETTGAGPATTPGGWRGPRSGSVLAVGELGLRLLDGERALLGHDPRRHLLARD